MEDENCLKKPLHGESQNWRTWFVWVRPFKSPCPLWSSSQDWYFFIKLNVTRIVLMSNHFTSMIGLFNLNFCFLAIKDLVLILESWKKQLLCKELIVEMMKPKHVCFLFYLFCFLTVDKHNQLFLKAERKKGELPFPIP